MPNMVAYQSIYIGVTDSGTVYKFDPQVPQNSRKLETVPSRNWPFAIGCHAHPDIGEVYVVMDNAGKAWRGPINGSIPLTELL